MYVMSTAPLEQCPQGHDIVFTSGSNVCDEHSTSEAMPTRTGYSVYYKVAMYVMSTAPLEQCPQGQDIVFTSDSNVCDEHSTSEAMPTRTGYSIYLR